MTDRISQCCGVRLIEDTNQCCFVCAKCWQACEISGLEYDIFLSSALDENSYLPVYDLLHQVLPNLNIWKFDETDNNSWLVNRYAALEKSKTILVVMTDFSMPIAMADIGMYYAIQSIESRLSTDNMIIVCPSGLFSDYYVKKIISCGQLVETIEEAIEIIKRFF